MAARLLIILCRGVVSIRNRRSSPLSRGCRHRYKLELVASDPQIVYAIGMAFDPKGRLLVIESHTHDRPQGYAGPAGDRIRMSRFRWRREPRHWARLPRFR